MTLDEVLGSLFPSGHTVNRGPSGTLHGTAKVEGKSEVTVVGIVGGTPLGVDGAILLADHVLAAVKAGGRTPIIFLVDTASQNMARRDELLGQRDAPLRIDGEVIFPDGSAVNWRELWNAYRTADRAKVLAKTMEGVRLLDIASLSGVGQPA